MPLDGAEFLPLPLLDQSTSEGVRYRPSALLPSKWQDATLFTISPASETLATLCLLEAARGLIEAPLHWTQGAYETLDGRYCAAGALRALGRRWHDPPPVCAAYELLRVVARARGFTNVEIMNDRSTHEQVLSAFDEAIAATRQRLKVSTQL